MESIVLEFDHVTGKMGKFRLQDISFALPAGYMMGLVGANGAGKTTCLNYVMREKNCYTGSIRIDGKERMQKGTAFRNQVGFVSEDNVFFEERTGAQNVELLKNFYDHFDKALFSETMERLGVSPGKSYYKMSRGERMKFQMAFAMAHHPRLYLLDEVTAGMDPVFRIDFFKLLHEICILVYSNIAQFFNMLYILFNIRYCFFCHKALIFLHTSYCLCKSINNSYYLSLIFIIIFIWCNKI